MVAVEDFIDVGNILGKSWVSLWIKGWSLPVRGFFLFVCEQKAYAANITDGVDQLLIYTMYSISLL